jgi:ankyrin repeat protein
MTDSAMTKPTPDELTVAVNQNDVKAVEEFLRRGADINKKGTYGKTPLMFAVHLSDAEMVRLLIDNGAKIDATDNGGGTALIYSVAGNKLKAVQLLIDNGADITMRNHSGVNAQFLAEKADRPAIEQLLKEGLELQRRRAAETEAARAAHALAIKRQQDLKARAPKVVIRGLRA